MSNEQALSPCQNTDRELWREVEGDYYAPSIHVTKDGGIGTNVGGHVVVMPLRDWHALAGRPSPARDKVLEAFLQTQMMLEQIAHLKSTDFAGVHRRIIANRAALKAQPPSTDPEACRRCSQPNPSWSAPSPLWNAVMRGGDINGAPLFSDMVCATCFMTIAQEAGIASGFRVDAREVSVDLQTVTPSGRVWDAKRWLWVEPPSTVGEDATEGEFVMVPRQLTPEMEEAHYRAHAEARNVFADAAAVWSAMISAAPKPTQPIGMDEREKIAQRLQDHFEQHHGVVLRASEWDAAVDAALSATPASVGEVVEALKDLAEEARNACDVRNHIGLGNAPFEADAIVVRFHHDRLTGKVRAQSADGQR